MKSFRFLPMAVVLMALLAVMSSSVYASPTLPDTGVDVSSYVTVLVSGLGAVIATVIGATFALFIVRRAISWVKGYVR